MNTLTKIKPESSKKFSRPDYEIIVIGSILQNPENIPKVSGILKGEHFSEYSNKVVYKTLIEMGKQGKPINLITVETELKDKRTNIDGDYVFLAQAMKDTTTSENINYYSKVLIDNYAKKLRHTELLNALNNEDKAEKLIPLKQDDNFITFEKAVDKFGIKFGSGDWDIPYLWLANNYIPFNSIGFISGPSGEGKTFCAIEIIGAIAMGIPAFNQIEVPEDKQGAVAYHTVEGVQGLAHRLKAWQQSRNISDEDWQKRVWQGTKPFNFKDTSPVIYAEFIKQLEKQTGEKLRCVIIDTFRNHSGVAQENSSTDIQAAINWMREVRDLLKTTVLCVHHTGKKDDLKVGCDFQKLLRGSSDIGCSAEFVLGVMQGEVEELNDPVPFFWAAKLKDAEKQQPIPARIVTHDLILTSGDIQPVGVISKHQKELTLTSTSTVKSTVKDAVVEFIKSHLETCKDNQDYAVAITNAYKSHAKLNGTNVKDDTLRKQCSTGIINLLKLDDYSREKDLIFKAA